VDDQVEPFKSMEEMFPAGEPENGIVYVFLLKHDPEIADGKLDMAFDWTQEDRERMAAFRHQAAKTSWCASRVFARTALARMTGLAWRELPWSANGFGKPQLTDSNISFNWSHTEGCLAFSACSDMDIGCDIEFAERRTGFYLDIAKQYFLAEESNWVGDVQGQESWERFLSLFVQKEAWLKSLGIGLDAPLSSAPARLGKPGFRGKGSLLLEAEFPERYYVSVRVSTNRTEPVSTPVSFIVRSCTHLSQ
jgi:phosphopantetheinyl transferase